jgi:hypothetical protein
LNTNLIRHQLSATHIIHPSQGLQREGSRAARFVLIAALSVLTAPAIALCMRVWASAVLRAQAVIGIGTRSNMRSVRDPATFAAIRPLGCQFISLRIRCRPFRSAQRRGRCAVLAGRISAGDQFFNRQCAVAVGVRFSKCAAAQACIAASISSGRSAIRIDVEVFERPAFPCRWVGFAGLGGGANVMPAAIAAKEVSFHRPFWVLW